MRELIVIRNSKTKNGRGKILPLFTPMENHYQINQQLHGIANELKTLQHDITTIKTDLKTSQNSISRIESFINNDPATGTIGIVNKVANIEHRIGKMEREYNYFKGKLVAWGSMISILATILVQWIKSLIG